MLKATFQALSLAFSMALITPVMAASAATDMSARTKTEAPARVSQETAKAGEGATDQVSINSATAQELAAVLNGVGLKKAESIVSYRDKYGPFSQVEQLKEVPGIGQALVERNLSRIKL